MNYARSIALILFSALLGLSHQTYAMQAKGGASTTARILQSFSSAFRNIPSVNTQNTQQKFLTASENKPENGENESAGPTSLKLQRAGQKPGFLDSLTSFAQQAKNAITSGSATLATGLQDIQHQAHTISAAVGQGIKNGLPLTFFPTTSLRSDELRLSKPASTSATQALPYKPENLPSVPAVPLSPEERAALAEDADENLLENTENAPVEPEHDTTSIPADLAETAHEEGSLPLQQAQKKSKSRNEKIDELRRYDFNELVGGFPLVKGFNRTIAQAMPETRSNSATSTASHAVKVIGGMPILPQKNYAQKTTAQQSTLLRAAPQQLPSSPKATPDSRRRATLLPERQKVERQDRRKRVIVSPASPLSCVLPHNPRAHMISYGQRVMPVIPGSISQTSSTSSRVITPVQRLTADLNPVMSSFMPQAPKATRGRPKKSNPLTLSVRQNTILTDVSKGAITAPKPTTNIPQNSNLIPEVPAVPTSASSTSLSIHKTANNMATTGAILNPFPELHRVLEQSVMLTAQANNNFPVYTQELHRAQTAQFVQVLIDTDLAELFLRGTGFSYTPHNISSLADMHGNTVAVFGKAVEGLIPCYVTEPIAKKITQAMEIMSERAPHMLRNSASHPTTPIQVFRLGRLRRTSTPNGIYPELVEGAGQERLFIFTRNQSHATRVFNAMSENIMQQRATQQLQRPTSHARAITHVVNSAAPAQTQTTSVAPTPITSQTATQYHSTKTKPVLRSFSGVEPSTQHSTTPHVARNLNMEHERPFHNQEFRRPIPQQNTQGHHENPRAEHRRTRRENPNTDYKEGGDKYHQDNSSQGGQQHFGTNPNYQYVQPLIGPSPLVPLLPRLQIIPDLFRENTGSGSGFVPAPAPHAPLLPPIIPPAPPIIDPVDPAEPLIPDWLFQENEPVPAPVAPQNDAPSAFAEATAGQVRPTEQPVYHYSEEPYTNIDIPDYAQHNTMPTYSTLAPLQKNEQQQPRYEQPYTPAPYVPNYAAPQPNYSGNGGMPSYGNYPNTVPAVKTSLERTPYKDTVVKPFRTAFSVLTPSELAKKRHERMMRKGA